MARKPRRISGTGYYHVVICGNGKQPLFEDDADRRAFLEALALAIDRYRVSLIAWCLMDNHVHLCLREDDESCGESLSRAMLVVQTRYSSRFNGRSERKGHVFEGRFKSVAIEDEAHLLAAVWYIHANPERAGICPAAEYRWSSCGEYLGAPDLCDTGPVLEALGGAEGFAAFMASDAPCGPSGPYRFASGTRVPDADMLEVAEGLLGGIDPKDIKALPRAQRDRLLLALRSGGLSVRQIVRLTGLGKNTITRATVGKMGQLGPDPN